MLNPINLTIVIIVLAAAPLQSLAQNGDAISCAMTKPAPEVTVLIYGQHAGRFELRFTDGPMQVRRALLETLDLAPAEEGDPGEFIVERLGIGSHVFENVPVIAWDPPPLYTDDNVPDGVLTLDLFKGRLVTLDVANGEIRIDEGDLSTAATALPYTMADGEGGRTVFFNARLGDKPLELALSANTQTTIHFSDSAPASLPLQGEPGLVGRVITEKGESIITGARLALPLVAGGLVLESAGVRFSDLFETPTLGIAGLDTYAITFDHTHRRLSFARSVRHEAGESAGAITLIDDSLASLKEAFNRDQDQVRLVMILSPT